MKTIVVPHHRYGCIPGRRVSAWRYGVAQRAVGDERWHGYWPSYETRAEAEAAVRWYEAGAGDGYEFAVAEFPPESEFSPRMEVA